jgi:hypothetical protein
MTTPTMTTPEDTRPTPPFWLVRGLLVAGQPVVLGGPMKCLKTATLIDLALSVANGTPFLGRFEVERPVRVALINGEGGQVAVQETARRVCQAKGIDLALGVGCGQRPARPNRRRWHRGEG